MEHARLPLTSLTPHPRNARRGNLDAIKQSLEQHGQYKPLVVQASTRHVLAGNHTRAALLELGEVEADVVLVDVDDEQALRILLADNRTSDLGAYDDTALVDLLRELAANDEALLGTGYNPVDLDNLIRLTTDQNGVDPEAEWLGMPEYDSNYLGPAFRTTVNFRTLDDAEAFFKLLDRPRTSTFQWPEHDGHVGSSLHHEHVAATTADPALIIEGERLP